MSLVNNNSKMMYKVASDLLGTSDKDTIRLYLPNNIFSLNQVIGYQEPFAKAEYPYASDIVLQATKLTHQYNATYDLFVATRNNSNVIKELRPMNLRDLSETTKYLQRHESKDVKEIKEDTSSQPDIDSTVRHDFSKHQFKSTSLFNVNSLPTKKDHKRVYHRHHRQAKANNYTQLSLL